MPTQVLFEGLCTLKKVNFLMTFTNTKMSLEKKIII